MRIIDNTTPTCGFCGMPVLVQPTWWGGVAYHFECAHGPGGPLPAQISPKTLTEEDVRRIVREEMAAMWRSQTTGAKELK